MYNFVKQRISNMLLMIFIAFSLLLPIYYAAFDSPYYTEFTFANLFIGVWIIFTLFTTKRSSENRSFICYNILILSAYILCSLYINFTHSRWIWETFNVSLAFLLFTILLVYTNKPTFNRRAIIKFLIICQTLTTILGIVTYFMGYASVSLLNGNITLIPHDPNYYEKRFNWIYFHKSQYCFILLLFIALLFAYKKHFKNKLVFYALNFCCLFGIILSHTYTAFFASLLIFSGYFLDYIKPKLKKIQKKYWFLLIPILVILCIPVYIMAQERNIWTLGGRVYIWTESIRQILQNPLGVGTDFGPISFVVPGLTFKVYNCHNVFLNEMYRFSLPVGLLFMIMFFSIIVYSLKKHFSFLNLGIWGALLISLNMDYALLGRELTITMFYFYAIFFLPYTNKNSEKCDIQSQKK